MLGRRGEGMQETLSFFSLWYPQLLVLVAAVYTWNIFTGPTEMVIIGENKNRRWNQQYFLFKGNILLHTTVQIF